MKKKARDLKVGDRVYISKHGEIPTAQPQWYTCDHITHIASSGGIRVSIYENNKWIRTIRGSQSVFVEN